MTGYTRNHLKESAFPLLHESQVVIRVERLTKEEREQILYNHIRLGSQTVPFKSKIKPFLPSVASNKHFSPEIARRLGNPIFTKRLGISRVGLDDFVARPVDLLKEVVRTLDPASRSALALVFMHGGSMPSPMRLASEERNAMELIGGSPAEVRNALSALDGSLLNLTRQGSGQFWRFKHPTVRDAFASLVAEDRELMDIYLAGTPIEKLLDEVSCGDVGIEGVKVIVPRDRFEALLTRIRTFYRSRRGNERSVHWFLAYRCDREFLELYCRENPGFIASLSVRSYLTAVSDVDVIVRLHEFGLLPEAKRLSVVESIRELAVETPDSGCLRDGIRQLFSEQEFDQLLSSITSELFPNLDRQIEGWRSNWNGDDDPEDYFSELKEALKDYREVFQDKDDVVSEIDSGLGQIDGVIEDLRAEMPEEPEYDDIFFEGAGDSTHDDSRSIFDDVDQ